MPYFLRFFIPLTLAFNLSAYADPIVLPDMGDSSATEVSSAQEKNLGEGLMRFLRQNNLIETDPVIQSYIHSLGYQLVANSDESTQPFTFFVVSDNTINAFAAPGGFVGINAGLILTSEDESELAAVMAHEIAHITQRHIARTIESANKHRLTTSIALLAAILLGQDVEQLTEAAISTSIAATAQLQIDFTRAHEKEADFIGIKTLANTGFDPEGMPRFFERMQKAARLFGSELPEFLSTHPVTVNRIAESRNRARKLKNTPDQAHDLYKVVKARLRIKNTEKIKQFIDEYKNSDDKNTDKSVYLYTLAIACLKAGLPDEAIKHITPLTNKQPENMHYRLTEAAIRQSAGQKQGAHQIYKQLSRLYPYSYPITYYYTTFLLSIEKDQQAYALLLDYSRNRNVNAQLLKLMSEAASKTGKTAEAYLHLAEHNFLNGKTHQAITHLNTAAKQKGTDYYLASKIEARLKDYKQIAKLEK